MWQLQSQEWKTGNVDESRVEPVETWKSLLRLRIDVDEVTIGGCDASLTIVDAIIKSSRARLHAHLGLPPALGDVL